MEIPNGMDCDGFAYGKIVTEDIGNGHYLWHQTGFLDAYQAWAHARNLMDMKMIFYHSFNYQFYRHVYKM